jgi:hypothetical protein
MFETGRPPLRPPLRSPAKTPPVKPGSEALAAAKEKAIELGLLEFREHYGESLTRDGYVQVARAFRSAVVPKRKPGRRPKAQVTAALEDWKTGLRGDALFRAHLPGWENKSKWRQRCESRALMDAIRTREKRDAVRRRSPSGRALEREEDADLP